MKYKVLFLMVMIGLSSLVANAQRGVRIGYIDTEYILQKSSRMEIWNRSAFNSNRYKEKTTQ